MNLGVETVGGFCDVVIPANSPVPCERHRAFRTASDDQAAVVVRICEGEGERFDQNTALGDLRLSGVRAAPRGEVEIVVTFEIDADGILNVEAKEASTGQMAKARIVLLGADIDAKRVAAMMELLTNPKLRPLYDEGLSRGHLRYIEGEAAQAAREAQRNVKALEEVAATPKAKELARKADGLLAAGKSEEARVVLTDAVQDDFDNAELRTRLNALYTADGYEQL